MPNEFTVKQTLSFWSRVEVIDFFDCWEWSGYTNDDGYGRITMYRKGGFKHYRVHRLAWLLTYGEIPESLMVLHRCGNPSCCNANHLYLGNHDDNMRDKKEHNRLRKQHHSLLLPRFRNATNPLSKH